MIISKKKKNKKSNTNKTLLFCKILRLYGKNTEESETIDTTLNKYLPFLIFISLIYGELRAKERTIMNESEVR